MFLCLFARTCPNINMTEWLPNLWIFWTSCTHRKRTCSNWLTGLRYSKELNFYFPQLFFVVTCKHKALQLSSFIIDTPDPRLSTCTPWSTEKSTCVTEAGQTKAERPTGSAHERNSGRVSRVRCSRFKLDLIIWSKNLLDF